MKNSTTKRRIKIGKTETVIEKINALNIKKRGCVACFLYKSHIYLSSKKAWLLNSSQLDCLIGVCRSKTFTCNSRCLFTTKLTLAVNRGSELVHRHKAISIAQMESIPLVTPVKGSYLYSLINEILASEKPNIVMQSNQLTTLKYMLRVDCVAAIIYDGLFNDDEDIVHIPFEEDIFLETHVFWQAGRYVSSSLKSFMSYISKVDFGSDTGLTVIQRENVPPA